ncbi:HpcH/HpaI aldolase/citrate lyase family protein [Flexivirga oryzae]|uniref:Citrate lyase subunit beta/citryl-CoA lyase n=1 Tax=Flexivirga oryzae TaxID=1794944 RepID=A0A839NBG5_9MICO|nr:CoA ester lyase [Flexivirga oryzae]MBB2893583.1 citrate lyase subunit beta/citryl-CoA lyase [Flexivirga oryzae]
MSRLDSGRTFLFVPGDRPERFAKAVAAGADVVVVDLEDAVAPEAKESARAAVVTWLGSLSSEAAAAVVVRVNAAGTPWHEADLEAVAGRAGAVMMAKAEAGTPLAAAGRRVPVIALIETATGALDARAIAATEGVVRLAFGSFDLAAELGIDPLDAQALVPSRGALVLASAAAGIAGPIDGVHAAIDDVEALTAEADAARRLGFGGKLCIHPRQVAVVDAVLRPSAADVAWARSILDATAVAHEGGVATVDGRMVDKPVIDRATRIIAAAARKEDA